VSGKFQRLLSSSNVSTDVPPLLVRLIEDATGRRHDGVWYESLLALPTALERAVAKRGEDPLPGLEAFLAEVEGSGAAEIPLTFGLMSALDRLADARTTGLDVVAKFRIDGLAAELYPTPVELGAVICACHDRGLPFKLTAGAHRAVRQTDPETGLVHHGFLNVLLAALAADEGGEPVDLAEILAGLDALALAEATRANLTRERPLWIGFGTFDVAAPLSDLTALGLLPRRR
jgi:hypothetical protein